MAQTTIIRHDDAAAFESGLRSFFAYRDLGIREASAGRVGAHVIRAAPGTAARPQWHAHALEFQMVYVLRGWIEFEYEDVGCVRLAAGSSVYQPPGIRHRELGHSEDVEMLEITVPASFETTLVDAPAHASG